MVADKVQILRDWIEQGGRWQNWVAQQIGCLPQWLNCVLKGSKLLSDGRLLTWFVETVTRHRGVNM